ncbi:MAG: TerB family tellurite resistance protein [Bacteroidales bacterium]|nr:TerB family tellurite resistance protein [Bacteroidales bacterium]
MHTINLTSIHYFGFIYLSFAHQTDGVYSKDEQNTLWKCLLKWMPENSEHAEFTKIMDETMQWYKKMKDDDDFQENLIIIAERMNDFDWFTEERKIESLKDLKAIALSDKNFLDNEKKWMRIIAKAWNLNSSIVRKIAK